jgi:SAM-dependent methyltransferase
MGSRPADSFASAVSQYARYRSGYPADEVARLASRVGLDAGKQAIDIGCGTGQLTIPLARHAGRVVAIDPVVAMLDHGRAAARAAALTNITWVQGDSTRLAELVEPGSQLATFAACFHWTDRAQTVEALDALLARPASVVVIDDDLDDAELPDWDHAIGEVRSHYPGLDAAPGALGRLPERHRDVLERSAFAHVETFTWSWTRQLALEQVVGLQLTYSFSTPARLGDRLDEFCAEIRDAVLTLHPSGVVREPFRVEVLVATRP